MPELIYIPADPTLPIEMLTRRKDDLDGLQELVGGWLEASTCGLAVAWMNEEGKLQGLPVNPRATVLWHRMLGYQPGDVLCGNVYFTGRPDSRGDWTSPPAEVWNLTENWRNE